MKLAGDVRDQPLLSAAIVTAASLALALLLLPVDPAGAYGALLVAGLLGAGICLGGAALVALCVLTGASWWNPIRRVPMAVALLIPIPTVFLAIAVFAGRTALYPWSDPEIVAASEILQSKVAWLNGPFFLLRAALILAFWLIGVAALRKRLAEVLQAPSSASRFRLARTSVFFLLLFAVTMSVASFDWAMSLEPEWFSTMYGVYLFCGAFLGGLAAVTALCSTPAERVVGEPVDRAVLHDLGKLLFGVSAFWAYIWFCQYLLIWYANIPEESIYFVLRDNPRWVAGFWLVPVLSFVVPFAILLPARPKRSRITLMQVSIVVLLGRALDLYVMILPPLDAAPAAHVVTLVVCGGLLVAMVLALPRAMRATQQRKIAEAEVG